MDDTARISIVGRARDMIISGGYNIYPKEINTLGSVKETAVPGEPHPDHGESVKAVVVANDRHQPMKPKFWIRCRENWHVSNSPGKLISLLNYLATVWARYKKEQLWKTYQTHFSSNEYQP